MTKLLGSLSLFLSISLSLAACGTDSVGDTASATTGTTCPASGQACQADADCPSNEECEDGACKAHGGADCTEDDGTDPQGGECVADVDCGAGLECEDGSCKPHGGDGTEDDGTDPQGSECTVDPDCGAGLECEDGLCKPHGGA